MVTNKKIVSTRISEENFRAVQIICEREKMNTYDFLSGLIAKEANKVTGKAITSFPNFGENNFEYDPESDSFIWAIHTGAESPIIISSKLSPHFIENVFNSMKSGLDKRAKFLKMLKKNKTYVPESIIRFKEK